MEAEKGNFRMHLNFSGPQFVETPSRILLVWKQVGLKLASIYLMLQSKLSVVDVLAVSRWMHMHNSIVIRIIVTITVIG